MMKRLSNLLQRDFRPRDIAEPAAAPAPQPAANRAARPRERDRNRHAALQPAAENRPARAASPQPRSPARLADAMARIDLAQRGSPPRAAAAVNEPEPQLQAPPAFDLKLSDLRMHRNETDHNLVFAYPIPPGVYEPVALAVDAASAGLEGRAYLEFLKSDPRTGVGMMVLLESKILRSDKPLPEERLNDIAARLRGVMAEAYLSDALMGEIEVIANEAIPHCHDRTNVAIGQMEEAALHARLIRGGVTDETVLYNFGVSFFMLNALQDETRRLLAEGLPTDQLPKPLVFDIQNAHYYLQEILHLPHRLQQPIAPLARGCIVSPRVAKEVILPRVIARAVENDGQKVMQFVSNWAPWRRHVDENWPPVKQIRAAFHRCLIITMENSEIPGSLNSRLSEAEYVNKLREIAADKVRSETELVTQLTLEFLCNQNAQHARANRDNFAETVDSIGASASEPVLTEHHQFSSEVSRAVLTIFGRTDATLGITNLLNQREAIGRACQLVTHLPAPLANKSAAVKAYYHALTSAFMQLHTTAQVLDSGLVTMNSRASAQVNGLYKIIAYAPDIVKSAAASVPAPIGAIANVLSSAWIYQRDTKVANSVTTFGDLLGMSISAALTAQTAALHICLQRQEELEQIHSDAQQSATTSRFAKVRNQIKEWNTFAEKNNLLTIDHHQSPLDLQAKNDLRKVQKAILKCLIDEPDRYLALKESEADKVDFLLNALKLNPVSSSFIAHGDANSVTGLANVVSVSIPAAAEPVRGVDEVKSATVAREDHDNLEQSVAALTTLVQELARQRHPNQFTVSAALDQGQQIQAMLVQLHRNNAHEELLGGAKTTMTLQHAMDLIFATLQAISSGQGAIPEPITMGIENNSEQIRLLAGGLAEVRDQLQLQQKQARCCTVS